MIKNDALKTALWEADRHLATLETALRDWSAAPATDLAELEQHPDKVRILDQLLFRFTKLQDTLGLRLIPATLAKLAEPYEDWPMLDRLNRLEKLGFLSVADWLRWRETRNRLAHEYPDEPAVRFATLTAAIATAVELAECYQLWRVRLQQLGANLGECQSPA